MRTFLQSVLVLLLISSFKIYGQQSDPFVRFPALNPDASQIAFSYQGDIWVVPSSGGEAVRLTIHEGYDRMPKWSPDGKQIAFSSSRYGNNDVFVIPAKGGMPKRLTVNSANDIVSNWTNDGKILFETRREFVQLEREPETYIVSSEGGTPYRFLNAIGSHPAMSPNGRFIAFVKGECRLTRETYRGPAQRDIWLFDTKNKTYYQITNSDAQDFYPNWGNDNTLYFISARSGKYNIFKVKIDNDGKTDGQPAQLTNYKDDGVRYFNISADGKQIVFERQISIYTMPSAGGTPQKISIQVPHDYRFDPVEFKTLTKGAEEYAVSPNSKYTALVVRGEVFVSENKKDIKRAVDVSNNPYRDMNPVWLSDSTLIFTSDRNDNNFDLYLVSSSDKNETNLYKTLKRKTARLTDTDEDESNPVISPDGKKIAYVEGRGKLIVADISPAGKMSGQKVLLDGWAAPDGIAWSPDSKWLSYSLDDLYFNTEVYIQAADNSGKPVNVSMHPRSDVTPVWSPDGSKLAFISARHNLSNDVWFVWLNKADWENTKQDWLEKEDNGDKKPAKKDKDSAKVKPVKIDFDKIYERLVHVTSLPGNEGNIAISKDGETFYFTAYNTNAKRNDLYKIKWDGSELKELTKGGANPHAVSIDKEGKNLYYFGSGGSFHKMDLKSDKSETLAYEGKMKIDYNAERNQMFEEAWRTLNNGFYDPNFHGQNWTALKEKYKPWCMAASNEDDFRDMFNIMLGKINASHMGMYGGDRAETQNIKTGLLGAELIPIDGGMKVNRVVPNSPADKVESKLVNDDVIISVDGINVADVDNFYSLLENKANDKVVLEVKNKDGKTREVVIRPVSNENQLLYKEWVQQRKDLTDKYSNGRLGYIHIQGMSMPSFEDFERDLTAAGDGKDGLVVDVRYNGGGWTTDYLMTVLNYKQHAYTIPRGATDNLKKNHTKFRDYYPLGERLVYAAWLKPSIALCNQASYSNAEIFSHAYKTLGIGKLVGTPTFGAVISTGGRSLINGSYVRLPSRGWYVKATDENMEWGPAVPQIIVKNPPDCKAKGVDLQLKAACDELLKEIDSK